MQQSRPKMIFFPAGDADWPRILVGHINQLGVAWRRRRLGARGDSRKFQGSSICRRGCGKPMLEMSKTLEGNFHGEENPGEMAENAVFFEVFGPPGRERAPIRPSWPTSRLGSG
jgi:hypothetical protein